MLVAPGAKPNFEFNATFSSLQNRGSPSSRLLSTKNRTSTKIYVSLSVISRSGGKETLCQIDFCKTCKYLWIGTGSQCNHPIARSVGDRRVWRIDVLPEQFSDDVDSVLSRQLCLPTIYEYPDHRQFMSIRIIDGCHEIPKGCWDRLHRIGSFQTSAQAKKNQNQTLREREHH